MVMAEQEGGPVLVLAAAAEHAVAELEELALGAAWAPAVEAARAAIEDLDVAARASLFRVVPVGADLAADLAVYTDHATAETLGAVLVGLHAAALDGHPELARALRTPAVLGRIAAVAGRRAVALQRQPQELGAEAVEAYVLAVAGQLQARGAGGRAAAALAQTVPALRARVAGSVATREAHNQAEVERIRAEEGIAESAREQDRAQAREARQRDLDELRRSHAALARREGLAAWFRRYGSQTYDVQGEAMLGDAIAQLLLQGDGDVDALEAVALRACW